MVSKILKKILPERGKSAAPRDQCSRSAVAVLERGSAHRSGKVWCAGSFLGDGRRAAGQESLSEDFEMSHTSQRIEVVAERSRPQQCVATEAPLVAVK